MTDFHHIIMTRFNLATVGREVSYRNLPNWLENRFHLFEKYCLPSVAEQTNKNFDWIIYFDIDTPDVFKDRVKALQAIVDFKAYYTPLFDGSGWNRSINETFPRTSDCLLTTRLDNDDVLARDFIETKQTYVRENFLPGSCYNPLNGFVMKDGALFRIQHESNPFFSILSQWDETLQVAPAVLHMALRTMAAVHQIKAPPLWLQVVHGQNVSNKIRGKRVEKLALEGRFPDFLNGELNDPSPLETLLDRAVFGPARDCRDFVLNLRHHR